MPYHLAPMDSVYTPPSYDQPDWEDEANVCLILLTQQDPVGFLIWQEGETLALLPTTSVRLPVSYGIYRRLSDQLRADAKAGVPAVDARLKIMQATVHRAVATRFLPDLLAEIREYTDKLWAPSEGGRGGR